MLTVTVEPLSRRICGKFASLKNRICCRLSAVAL
jgi:hypothetical protein